jgi:hypothetical protein
MIPLSKMLNPLGFPAPEWLQYLTKIEPQSVTGTSQSGVFIPSVSAGTEFVIVLTENTLIQNPVNLPGRGITINIELIQDAVGGRVITLGTLYKFPGGIVPVWSVAANARNLLTAYYDGTYLLCSGGIGYS